MQVIHLEEFFTFDKAPGDDLSKRKLSERTKQRLARFPRSDMLAFCDVTPYSCSQRAVNDDRIVYVICRNSNLVVTILCKSAAAGRSFRYRMRDRKKLMSGRSCASKARRLRGATFGSSLVQVLNGRVRQHCRNAVIEVVTVPNKSKSKLGIQFHHQQIRARSEISRIFASSQRDKFSRIACFQDVR